MKLYYAQAACSLAPHIALREAKLPFTLIRFDMKTKLLSDGRPIEEVNDKGYVPVLELDSGERLSEVSAILQYVADQAPQSKLAPPPGTFERYRLIEWLNFIATEVHKPYWPLFHDGTEAELAHARDKLGKSFTWIQKHLPGEFAYGDGFSVADAYLFTTLNWARAGGLDLDAWPALSSFRKRMRERPAIQAAMEAEGMLRKRTG